MPKFKVLSRVIAASTISIGFLSVTSAARAANLVPQQEGEIQLTNMACLSSTNPKCIDTSSGANGFTVTSLSYDSQFSESRLFVDKRNTVNDYSSFGIQFLGQDAGTNTTLGEYWLRPVAYTPNTQKVDSPKIDTSTKTVDAPVDASVGTTTSKAEPTIQTTIAANGKKTIKTTTVETTIVTRQIMVSAKVIENGKKVTKQVPKLVQDITTKTTNQTTTITPGTPVEKGQLEVGKFQFDFKNPLAGLKLNFFDVEDSKHTGILSYTNSAGKTFSIPELLAGKQDGNLQSLVIHDVVSFVVQLGNPGQKYGYKDSQFTTTGDGVDLQLQTVPEPGNLAGLGALAILGVTIARQHKKKTVDC
ncbi:LEVG family PEP-CTERM protein [Nostocaceae cyanobacterium CENA369]|uniref:LEVG family PEP-CTERM protein n=1 Tax=Dendronalium phyllosphericum CENA369 TaxID=1725256 RepID=A0A8J7LDQ9_9NOST|nr:LEVG family PEP-CTERM protein [Dendronalium phyllosphericum]MBH8574147.1 LEVG family PEP-CTERM protein [Dendronalium phyllosphericum CENA369]